MKILIANKFTNRLKKILSEFGEVTYNRKKLSEADIVIVRSKTKVDKEFIDRAKNLKMVIVGGVGIDNVDIEYCKKKKIKVRNVPKASAISVAELTLAFMLMSQRDLITAHNTTKSGKWEKNKLVGNELNGKILGIIGYGNIGSKVAQLAKALHPIIIYYDIQKKKSKYATPVKFKKLLQISDIITLHVPLDNTTKKMINKNTIDIMKKGVVLINASELEKER